MDAQNARKDELHVSHRLQDAYTKFQIDISKHVEK